MVAALGQFLELDNQEALVSTKVLDQHRGDRVGGPSLLTWRITIMLSLWEDQKSFP